MLLNVVGLRHLLLIMEGIGESLVEYSDKSPIKREPLKILLKI
jgi:hypothetical protein